MSSTKKQKRQDPCSSLEANQFDFWLGEWELSWPAEQSGGQAGQFGLGENRIEKIMNGCTLEENFSFADGSYQGRSWSVYSPLLGLWQQTWVDNSGAYLLFEGRFNNKIMELKTDTVERDGKRIVNRMVFSDIKQNSLKWDWQRSEDNGATWADLWNVSYQRK